METYIVESAEVKVAKNTNSYLECIIVPKELSASNCTESHKLLFYSEVVCKMWDAYKEAIDADKKPNPRHVAFFENILGKVVLVEDLPNFRLKSSRTGNWGPVRNSLRVFVLCDKEGAPTTSACEEARRMINNPEVGMWESPASATTAPGATTVVASEPVAEEQKPRFNPITGEPIE